MLSNRLTNVLCLSFVAALLLVQVVDRQHLHLNDPIDSVCEFCAQSDTNDATLASTFEPEIQTALTVELGAAVSAFLATKRWTPLSRAPPHTLA